MVKKCLDLIEKILMFVLGVLMTVMVVVVFMQVVLRYGFQSATNWADEVARYCMIWVVFLACPVGYRRHNHIRIDILTRYMPPRLQKIMEFCMYILQMVFLGVVLVAGWEYIGTIGGQRSIALEVNMQYVHLSTLIGVMLMIIFILERMYEDFLKPLLKKDGKEAAQ